MAASAICCCYNLQQIAMRHNIYCRLVIFVCVLLKQSLARVQNYTEQQFEWMQHMAKQQDIQIRCAVEELHCVVKEQAWNVMLTMPTSQ